MSKETVEIIISKEANSTEKFAAEELAKYLSKIFDRIRINIVTRQKARKAIYIGVLPDGLDSETFDSDILKELGELDNDGFIIRGISETLLILGKTSRATLFGVYHYLQILGVRWYFPGEENEYVPKRREILVKGINIKESPVFSKRGIVIDFDNTALCDWIDFMAKVKLNTLALHIQDISPMPTKAMDWLRNRAEVIKRILRLLETRGLDFNIEVHFFGSKFCTADLNELERSKNLLQEFLGLIPREITDFFLWPADRPLERCDCLQDHDLSLSDQVLIFTNRMLKALREIRPGARLSFIQYFSTWQPPRSIKPLDGVFLEIAPIHQCFSHSVCDPVCEININDVLPQIEESLNSFNPKEAQVLGYWLDSSLFGRGEFKELFGRLPQFGGIIKQDLNYYLKKGIRAITTFVVGLDKDYFSTFTSPTVFQYAQLLWNPQMDLEPELVVFCETFYGRSDLTRVFELYERIDPKDFSGLTYIDKISDSIELIRKTLMETECIAIQTRLKRLLGELYLLRCWLKSIGNPPNH